MGSSAIADQYFTYDSRLSSFQTAHQLAKRRASNASTKGSKSIKWPHKFMTGEELARAGFFYHPTQSNPDNVACFLCHKNLDGWEEDDDPLAEHLKLSPNCGWAIVASIEKGDEELSLQYPASSSMIEARKATFADHWPHEGKKGWKCKTKQMVDSGWKYTPTSDSDDMATCVYCSLALDGWEPADKPMDEHFKRSSDCAFFTLISNHKQSPAVKRTKGKGRASKVSRLSTQSALTVASEAPSVSELAAEDDDSILTTATNATATTRGKKMGKAKKAAPAKRTRAKKGEPVEVVAAMEPEDDNLEVKVEVAPKPTRGRKRKSDEDTESVPPLEDMAPPPKRRATRTRASTAMDDSVIRQAELPKPAGRKGRASRKTSAASVASMRAPVPDDDEIDRALEAGLARSLTDDEEEPAEMSTTSHIQNTNHALFDTEPVRIDEAVIDAELEAMETESKPLPKAKGAKAKQPRKVSAKQRAAAKKAEAEAEAERLAAEEASQQIAAELEHSISMQQSSPVVVPKKQRASTRQPTKQLPGRATRASVMDNADNDTVMDDETAQDENDSGNETDASMASQSTVVRGGSTRRGSTMKKGTGGKKDSSRNIEEIVHKGSESEAPHFEEAPRSARGMKINHAEEITVTEEVYYAQPDAAQPEQKEEEPAPEPTKAKATKARGRPRKISAQREPLPLMLTKSVNTKPAEEPTPVEATTSMPGAMPSSSPRSPTPPPKEMTPSQSPQSSDAENHPPSSKPSAATKKTVTPHSSARRIPLADATPGMLSPSKRNIIAGLQSNVPWTAVDLDAVFMKSPSGENTGNIFGGAIEKAKNGVLTSPEKKMTVEEWIKYNAEVAEEKLKGECERMVGLFETEGTRAMQALEGVEYLE
ncbi:BIR-domain-containing protein [Mollisia scopiformis]|uniref:BIR-domain-containing protein n=1 Tax=Mollisia scopiformis TaxID=149040 RepID=A0A194X9Y9_MOLSC|nr:BIR-domain-containing protein [Mollisia scopiformis]KUJ16985.1 BIR-domain-containing protein [Mollisia scopiformis]